MSVLVAVPGAPQLPDSVTLSGSSVEDIKVFEAGKTGIAFITAVIVANNTASPVQAKVYWTNDTTDYLLYTGSVAANSTESNVLDAPIAFNARPDAKKIRAQAASGVVVTVIHNLLQQNA